LTDSSDLAAQNLSRVAASAAQIEEVLRKEPGLMVELKRWVAKEATDRGQIVGDSDLTDQAIFDRLASDVEFRSVATRLLQRYGYLLPTLNPGSEAAREQETLLQARLQQLKAQVEKQEQEENVGPASEKKAAARGGKGEAVRGASPPAGANSLNPPEPSIPRPSLGSPLEARPTAPQKLLQTSGPTETEVVSQASDPSLSWSRSEAAAREEHSALAAELSERSATSPASPEAGNSGGVRSGSASPPSGEAMAADALPLVRRPNPYADIPSLYDMYRQVSSRPPELARFGMDVFRNDVRQLDSFPMDLPVGPDYVVGPGDGLAVDLWGGVSQRLYRSWTAKVVWPCQRWGRSW
jgi:hypothetical protein